METYEDHSWCSYSNHSEDEDDEDEDDESHPHNLHLAQVRSRSRSRSRRRSSFLVDELDMLMDKAATTIQASWRGHLTRRRLGTENAAAATIQAAWRRFITREYIALQQERVPSWRRQPPGRRRRRPSPASFGDRDSWAGPDEERAAEVIQAHYRGYVTRRAFCECRQAAVTIQAHWRGHRARQEVAQRARPTHPPRGPRGSYYGHPSHVPGSSAWVGPYPRKHWHKCLVGDPKEWACALSRDQDRPPRKHEHRPPAQAKTCSQCGRCTSVRVLVGVGKGPASASEAEESECEGHHASRSPSRRWQKKASSGRATEEQAGLRRHRHRAHVAYEVRAKAHYSSTARQVVTEERPRRTGREPRGLSPCYATGHAATRVRTTTRSLSSTSLQLQGVPSPGTSDWLYENYCARRAGEGQGRVFKTRKQLWQIARAATLIQSFWRGWKVRQALRVQQEAATKIQSAYRGYKTRIYLIEAGVLSEGDTE